MDRANSTRSQLLMRDILKALGLARLAHPARGLVTWASQLGFLPYSVAKHMPWSWVLEPFTIYGQGWKCRWSPTEFDALGHKLFFTGLRVWEKETAPVILEEIRRAHCVIDIGANCGVYTVLGCTVNPDVRVISVEPVPRAYTALANNIRQNGYESRVTALNVALSDSNGTASFHEAEDSTISSLALQRKGPLGRIIEVQCKTLDSVVEELQVKPDFLKIDVEGFEHLVLRGATKVLTRFRPCIVLEAIQAEPCAEITKILSEHGYVFQNITDRGLEARDTISPIKNFPNWRCSPRNGSTDSSARRAEIGGVHQGTI